MLDSIRKGQRWLTMLFVGVIGLVFVFFIGLGQPLESGPSAGAVVELGDVRLDVRDFERTRATQEQRFREALGEQFDAETARDFLDSQALQSLIDTAILAHSAGELGLVVSKQEIQELLKASPNFRDANGRFDRELFEDWAEYNFGSQRNFLSAMRNDLLGQKMVRLLYGQTSVSDGEARRAALHRLEEVRLAIVALDANQPPPGEMADDAAADAYLAENRAAVQEVYDSRLEAYTSPERVRARHILLKTSPVSTEEARAEVRARAEAALARIQAGEDFEAVAREVSEDPGTAEQGGDLGTFARGERVPEIEEVAFALEPGATSEIVQSPLGLHIVRVDERIAGGQRPFEEVARDIARELANAEIGRSYADRVSEELLQAIQNGQTLEDAARERGVPIDRPEPLRRRADGFVMGLGAAPEVLSAAFGLSEAEPSAKRVFQVDDQLVLIQLLERTQPDPDLLTESIEAEKRRLLATKRNQAVQDWIDADRRALSESGQLKIDPSIVTGS